MRMMTWVVMLVACGGERAPDTQPVPTPVIAANPTPPPKPPPDDLATKLPTAIGTGAIGTAHLVFFAEADPMTRWAILCQQRTDTDNDGKITFEPGHHFWLGDSPSVYLVIGGGAGVEVEDILAVSPTGDHLALRIGGVPMLVDIVRSTVHEIAGASEATFSVDGKRLVYLVTDKANDKAPPKIIRRDLATAKTTEHVLPPGSYGALQPDLTGRWVMIGTARVSVDKTRKPHFHPTEHWMDRFDDWCPSPGSDTETKHDPHIWLWLDLERGVVVDDQKIIRPAGDHVFTKNRGVISLDGKPLGPKCKEFSVFGVYEPRPGILINCTSPKQDTLVIYYVTADGNRIVEGMPEPFYPRAGLPRILVDKTYCFLENRKCIDLESDHVEEHRRPQQRGLFSTEFALARDGRVLVGVHEYQGPLSWKPRVLPQ